MLTWAMPGAFTAREEWLGRGSDSQPAVKKLSNGALDIYCQRPYNSTELAAGAVAMRQALGLPTEGVDSCALVGSSGQLLYDRLGAAIDSHSLVIRFNDAPTEGFEEVVGAKTGLRLLNSNAIIGVLERCAPLGTCSANLACCPRQALLNTGYDLLASCYQRVCGSGISLRSDSSQRLSSVLRHPLVFALANMKGGRKSVMSGLYGFAAALQLCHRTTAFGFTTPMVVGNTTTTAAAAASSAAAAQSGAASTVDGAPPPTLPASHYSGAATVLRNLTRREARKARDKELARFPCEHSRSSVYVCSLARSVSPPQPFHSLTSLPLRMHCSDHYYDSCAHSTGDAFRETVEKLHGHNPAFAKHASTVTFQASGNTARARPLLPCTKLPDEQLREQKRKQLVALERLLNSSSRLPPGGTAAVTSALAAASHTANAPAASSERSSSSAEEYMR